MVPVQGHFRLIAQEPTVPDKEVIARREGEHGSAGPVVVGALLTI